MTLGDLQSTLRDSAHRANLFKGFLYTLRIQFDDNTEQTIDFEPVLRGEIYGPLRDLSLFNQVKLDPEVRTLIWPNDADFDPADLHDWPEIEKGFIEHVMQWEPM